MGRPSEFSQGTADTICERIADGESLRHICMDDDMPAKSTVFKWLAQDKAFADQYAHARDAQADTLADDILDIADESQLDTFIDENGNERTNHEVVARSRLRVDARKWLASKMAPKKYGERIHQEMSGSLAIKPAKDLTDDELAAIAAGSGQRTADSPEGTR